MELIVILLLGWVGGSTLITWVLTRSNAYDESEACLCGDWTIPDDGAGVVSGRWPDETVHERNRCFPFREAVDIKFNDEGEG